MRHLIAKPATAAWVACDAEETLVGFALVRTARTKEGTVAYLETLEVAAEHRRKGVGAELLRRSADSARQKRACALWLHVAEDNFAAQALYRAHGFYEQGRERAYYGRGRDAIVLALDLIRDPQMDAE
jgi:ribosomal-protein-alanine N-acetyltransferase